MTAKPTTVERVGDGVLITLPNGTEVYLVGLEYAKNLGAALYKVATEAPDQVDRLLEQCATPKERPE